MAEKRCLRLERLYGDGNELAEYLRHLANAVDGDAAALQEVTVDKDEDTRRIDFNWGSSGP